MTKKIGIGNVGNIRELSSLHGHSDFINGIDFSPDSSLLVSGSWDSTVRLWNVRTGEQITSFAARGGTTDVHFVAKGEQIAASNYVQPEKGVHDFWFQIWGVKSTQEVASFQGPAWEKAISTARNGSLIAVGGNEIRLLSPPSFQTIKEWEPGTFGVNDVAFHPDGQFLAAVGAGDTVEIWDIEGNLVSSFEGPAGPRIASVSFSRDGTLLAAGSVNGQVRIWRTSNFQLINTLATGDANSLAFSVDNSLLAVGGAREVQLWSVSTGELVVNLSGFTHSIQTLTFSPNGDYLATAGEPIIKLWGIPEP
ncbi:MAG: hypothetical protein BroJett039_06960 [Chloroflexota bacterium]|nr:MAG: hypothetical protein BroJett039_06960 [Chloroflexota bacterium]